MKVGTRILHWIFSYISASSIDVSLNLGSIRRVIIICVPSDFTKGMPLRGLSLINNIGTFLAVFLSASTLTPFFTCFALIETPLHDSRYDWLMYMLVLIPLCAPTSLPFQFVYILL
jgi:hypothetical protein